MHARALLIWLALLLTQCGDSEQASTPEPSPGPKLVGPTAPHEGQEDESAREDQTGEATAAADGTPTTPAASVPEPLDLVPKHEERSFNQPFREEFSELDAAKDGWDTEVFEREATAQLDRFKEALRDPSAMPENLADTVLPQVLVSPPRPELEPVFRDHAVAVWRAGPAEGAPRERGHEALAKTLRRFLAP